MEIFSGKFDYYGYETEEGDESHFCGNPKLNGTAFFKFQYCNNNFNDFLKSLVILFELTVVNQWHDILSSYSCFYLLLFCTLLLIETDLQTKIIYI